MLACLLAWTDHLPEILKAIHCALVKYLQENKKKHQKDVGMACHKVCEQGRDDP